MVCFNCGVKLYKGDDKECRFCGVKYPLKCMICGSPNPLVGTYCFNCGSKLLKQDSKKGFQEIDFLYESRRNVAVIFADISGFTALSEKMDPEEVREIINDCFSYITKPVYKMEGTIDKYIGDCIMILFGAKNTHIDDARRAVLCALEMMRLIKEFSEKVLSSRGLSLNLSIGINYGLVVTGGIGNYYDKDYTVMGDIVNTAQRLQNSAGKGVILVSESVFYEARDVVRFSSMKEVKVKNKENPVRCYTALDLNRYSLLEQEEFFIDRKEQFGVLNTIYNDALNSGIQCAMITGEVGSGKTRLIKEFTSKVGNDIKRIWVDCSRLYKNKSYHMISSMLEKIMNINSNDNNNIKQHRLISFLNYILSKSNEEEIERCCNFLGILMGLEKKKEFKATLEEMSLEDIKKELSNQILLFFDSLCVKNKLIVIIDNLQWSDSNSLELVKEIMEGLESTGIIFILSSRYLVNELKTLSREGVFHFIRLSGLTLQNTEKLMLALLECKEVEESFLNTIFRLTGGNPSYIKEFLSNIKKSKKYSILSGKAILNEDEIVVFPESINNLILSNLSDLSYSENIILQAASVIGNEFNLSLVSFLLGYNVDEDDIKGLPIQLNIIKPKNVGYISDPKYTIYVFTRDLEREVIYDSILNKNKRKFHEKIGEFTVKKYN